MAGWVAGPRRNWVSEGGDGRRERVVTWIDRRLGGRLGRGGDLDPPGGGLAPFDEPREPLGRAMIGLLRLAPAIRSKGGADEPRRGIGLQDDEGLGKPELIIRKAQRVLLPTRQPFENIPARQRTRLNSSHLCAHRMPSSA